MDAALYALQINPPENEGDKNEIENQLIQILPSAVDVYTSEFITKGIRPVVLPQKVAEYTVSLRRELK